MLLKKIAACLLLGTLLSCRTTGPAAVPPLNVVAATAPNAWLEIDAGAFAQNIGTLKKMLAGSSQICAVLKADAYGHGLSLLMPTVISEGITCIGVTSNQEIRVARTSGFKGRIMRLRAATTSEINDAVQDNVEELAGNLQVAKAINDIAKRHALIIKIHIALNAGGMSRNGLELATPQGMDDALAITALPDLKTVGIMTHFPVEGREDVIAGLQRFNQQAAKLIALAQLDRSTLMLHTANSFATLTVPESRLDAVRPGGLLFGDVPDGHNEYRRVMQFKSRVAAVSKFPKGNTVGYDRTYTLKRDSVLANIPVGYSDGYSVSLSNKADVLIRGHRAAVVGRTSMNTIMVDVTDFAEVELNDEVVLFGKQGAEEITQKELENIDGKLFASLYTVWGNSNPKVLKGDRPEPAF